MALRSSIVNNKEDEAAQILSSLSEMIGQERLRRMLSSPLLWRATEDRFLGFNDHDTFRLFASGSTLVHDAARMPSPSMVRLLSRFGADFNVKNSLGRETALIAAIRSKAYATAAFMITNHDVLRIDLIVCNSEGNNALHYAYALSYEEDDMGTVRDNDRMLELAGLLEQEMNQDAVEAVNKHRHTPFGKRQQRLESARTDTSTITSIDPRTNISRAQKTAGRASVAIHASLGRFPTRQEVQPNRSPSRYGYEHPACPQPRVW